MIAGSQAATGGDDAARLEGRAQAGHLGHADIFHDVGVVPDLDQVADPVGLDPDDLDLLVEPARVPGSLGVDVGAVAELVGRFTADLVAPAQLLGGVGHRHA
jgi:hypothetical protein